MGYGRPPSHLLTPSPKGHGRAFCQPVLLLVYNFSHGREPQRTICYMEMIWMVVWWEAKWFRLARVGRHGGDSIPTG
ncbi:MAG: hypothetical protein KJ069_31815 [Anaerolineae bacterium]|nr:hypothetical protein [Anaerolineae bacterium]